MQLPLNNNYKAATGRLVVILKERSGLVLIALLIGAVLTTSLIVYLYIIKTPKLMISSQIINIDKRLYQKVIDRLNARQANIQLGTGKDYKDVFK